jgi:outer membrane protein OmpA-like peptidoglycan-associated protein
MGVVSLAAPIVAGGCSDVHNSGPEAWWHETIGGKINEQRPPPPGDKDPFPNLATVPPRPPPVDTAGWNRTTAGLITDRINARETAALNPIPTAASTPPAPLPYGATQGGTASDSSAGASLVGAAPSAGGKAGALTPTSAARGVPTASRSTGGPDVGFPGGSAPVASSPAGGIPFVDSPTLAAPPPISSTAAAQRVAGGHLPPLPSQAPPRPDIAPAPPPPLVPVTAAPPAPANPARGGAPVDFDSGSARLNDPALAEVRELAAIRGDRGIAITGYGDALSSDATAQSQAVTLGVSRAQALATALVAQGVPFARLRLNAEAAGRGASLRLLQ